MRKTWFWGGFIFSFSVDDSFWKMFITIIIIIIKNYNIYLILFILQSLIKFLIYTKFIYAFIIFNKVTYVCYMTSLGKFVKNYWRTVFHIIRLKHIESISLSMCMLSMCTLCLQLLMMFCEISKQQLRLYSQMLKKWK